MFSKQAHLESNLNGINFSNANLTEADLFETDLIKAKFRRARLVEARLMEANLEGADLVQANLEGANLSYANLKKTNLRGANLECATLRAAELSESNFEDLWIGATILVDVDLSNVAGLDSVHHWIPTSIGLDTLYLSNGKVSKKFLRGAGVPLDVIEHLLPLIRAGNPIQWHSCFISYSSKDDEFSRRLYSRMQRAGLTVFFAPEDMKGGDYFFEQIERAIQLHDRLLLVLSEDSIQSKWVEREIRKTRKIERAEKRRKLFPITLTDYATLKKWECLDSDTGEDLAEEVRKYHIPDFSNWKNPAAFARAFARLEKDLRTSIK